MSYFKMLSLLSGFLLLSCGSQSGGSSRGDGALPGNVAPVSEMSDGGTDLEKQLAWRIRGAAGQRRKSFVYDARLNRVARARAKDMAQRRYFSHVDPEGYGPNHHVIQSGYQLPISWGAFRKANYIESILGGPSTPEQAVTAFLNSPAHRKHIVGETSTYETQTRYGIGHFYDESSPYRHYWVLITAPPEGSER